MLVQLVEENLGDDGVGRLFEEAGLERRRYQPEVIYPEQEFQSLFRGAQAVFGADADAAEDVFSKFFMRKSPEMFPAIFKIAGSARKLFEKIPSIHQSFPAAASRGDYREKVHVAESSEERIVLEYTSPNQLCRTMRKVAEIVLEFYDEAGTVAETQCAKHGAPCCRIVVEFDGQKSP